MMCTTNGQDHAGRFSHQACVYAGTAELERGICRFVEEGLAGGEPALVVAPGERLQAVEAGLGAASEKVRLQDMTVHGLNPARIIPILLDWTERSGSPVRAVSEPLWPGRGDAEVVEVLRHEALVEAALGAAQAKLLCAYLQDALTGSARASLERSHHTVTVADGSVHHRAGKPRALAELLGPPRPLEPPPGPVEDLPVTRDLRRMRRQIRASDAAAALPPARCRDFVLAVNEAATNALQHGAPPRALRLWRRAGEVVGEVVGSGRIEDPLAGRRRPAASAVCGRGLWMVNQLCDLVELRSGPSRTTLRMHMRCA